ncbi:MULTISPECIES: GTP pyrophosphokinase [unclassified Rhodococcus (in: high G+C Gram-positive bacteria)]|uniref:GTP pyrophosphokinase n=1 Tax=unclassified Rhodococcus (in: high G+C Gram-positive bacteria) TaxID=192944 RepID=UPI0009EAA659|nr:MULTISPECIES: GTP pyrophosphokinase family protein [unclassified Rhodococcus (in: high G+C Gram-positive bacteria)]
MSATEPALSDLVAAREDFTRFMMSYQFGMNELTTKIDILKEEFTHLHSYSPIEHVVSRLKSPRSMVQKAVRKNIPLTFPALRAGLFDIAGVRITCSFIADTYRVKDMLASQNDVRILDFEDYIADPKPNGYRSLHLTVEIPVFLSDRVEHVYVELQIRTVAMDFWASLEHKIFYKYDGEVPRSIRDELQDAAEVANRLDVTMEHLHTEVRGLDAQPPRTTRGAPGVQELFLRSLFAGGEPGQ